MPNATFNNISFMCWKSVLFVEKLEYPGQIIKSLTNYITSSCI